MGVMNKNAVSIAYSPTKDKSGQSTIGLDFSDRPYLSVLKKDRKPYIGNLVVSRTLPVEYDLSLIVPFSGETFKGYCGGVVRLNQIQAILNSQVGKRKLHLTLLDRNGKVIMSTRNGLSVMDRYDHDLSTAERIDNTNARLWMPPFVPGKTILNPWKHALIISEKRVSSDLPWNIIVEAPVSAVVSTLSRNSTQTLVFVGMLLLLIIPLAYFVSLRLTNGIERLQHIMDEISGLPTVRGIEWPKSRIFEIRRLTEHVSRMTQALSDALSKQKSLSDNLEAQVANRTEAMESKKPSGPILEDLIAPDGSKKWFETHKNPKRNEKGDVVGLIGMSVDVTHRFHRNRLNNICCRRNRNFSPWSTISE